VTGDFTDDSKAALRTRVRLARAARPVAEREAAGPALADRVLALPSLSDARRVALYSSMATEPDTAPLLRRIAASHRELLLPRIRGEDLEWVVVTQDTTYVTGAFGITEPTDGHVAPLSTADVIVIPALSVDGTGMRLGQGGGYYDRALSAIAAPVIALVFDDELPAVVPSESHDHRVDVIVTPSRTIVIS